MCPHIPLKERTRCGRCYKSGDTEKEAQYLYSLPLRPKLRRVPEESKLRGFLAEDVVGDLLREQRSLLT